MYPDSSHKSDDPWGDNCNTYRNGNDRVCTDLSNYDNRAVGFVWVISHRFLAVSGSLIGVFRQGTRENIVVFSDEYFEEAKEFWKTSNIFMGTQEVYPGEGLEDQNPFIYQGMTKLVLMNIHDSRREDLMKELEQFEARHVEEEDQTYVVSYDKTVFYHYLKDDGIANLKLERVMKTVINTLVIILFFAMTLMLMLVKMLSELDITQQRAGFLKCMGMRKKDRVQL